MLPLTLLQVVGLFNIVAGLMLTAAIIIMGAGVAVWLLRLGTHPTYRDEAIKIMEWGVTVLFALLLLLILSQFVQQHTATAVYVLGFIILGVVAWAVWKAMQASGESDEH